MSTLLATLPHLRIVATTRQVLGVDGEHLLAVEPLPLPAPLPDAIAPGEPLLAELALNPAVALFVDRARERRADFHLGPQNAAAIAELARLLEGHPLAIELAAARVRSTPPAQWVALLREARAAAAFGESGETLSLLARAGPRAGGDVRHASMAQVIAGSWALLDDPARRLLGALSAFDGGCDATAALAVADPPARAAAVQRTLDDLVASSMLVAHERPAGAGDDPPALPRFVPYEAVREYAAAQFPPAQRAAWRARHRAWARTLGAPASATPDLARLRDEMPNVLLALHSALRDDAPDEAWAIAAAHRDALTDVTLPATGQDALEAALARVQDGGTRLLGHAVLAGQAYEAGQSVRAQGHAQAVMLALGSPDAVDTPLRAWALGWALRIRMRVGQAVDESDPWLDAALRVAARAGDAALEARLLGLRASLMMRNRADHVGAEALRRRALALAEASGDRLRTNEARIALAICLGFQHRIEEQLPLLATVEAEARALDQPRLRCFALSVRGYCLADLRRHEEAVAAFAACLRVAAPALAWRELFYGLWNLPRSLAHRREPERAARLMGFAEAFYAQRFGALGPEDTREARRTRRLVAVQLGRAGTDRAWHEGASLDMAQALRLALA